MIFIIVSLTLNFSIDRATFYNNNVLVQRTTSKKLIAGDYQIQTNIIPGNITGNIRISSDSNVILGEIKANTVFSDSVFKTKIKNLKDSISLLTDSILRLEDMIETIKSQEEFLNSIKVTMPKEFSTEFTKGKFDPIAFRNVLNFLGKNYSRFKTEKRKINKKISNCKEKINKLKKILNDLSGTGKTKFNRIIFPARVLSDGYHKFRLEYTIKDGGFYVFYVLREEPENNKTEIEYFADVWQLTGEDWKDIGITFSTAQPSYGANAPSPSPWYVNILGYTLPLKTELKGFEKIASAKNVAEDKERRVFPKTTPISITYSISGKRSILSQKKPQKVLINKNKLDSKFTYFTAPYMSKYAFLTAKTKNTTKNFYLSGRSYIYVGNEYVGEANIGNFFPDDEVALPGGVDRRIKVSRKLLKRFHKTKGILKKSEAVEFKYLNTVKNPLPVSIKITVLDRIPVTRDSRINIKDVKFFPKPDSIDKNSGFIFYKLNLKPNAIFSDTTSFTIEYPKGLRINL